MTVSQRVDGNPRQGIKVDLALGIGQPAAFAVTEGDRQAGVGIHQMGHRALPIA
ncbi:MAG: hypothetical protein AW07_03485 [Candidatus Accumulibacter sp. SK-11]|nr:MAG: hypothetical protein AW07_03485 [Candidatus Accumulibacter sp. SK-11]